VDIFFALDAEGYIDDIYGKDQEEFPEEVQPSGA
jgi:hypothetical protein